MYPRNTETALLEQLETERAIADLVELALDIWLPLAQHAVLDSAAPDPTAAADEQAQWDYLVDAVLLYGIAIAASDAYDRAYTALTGEPLPLSETSLAAAGLLPPYELPGMPSRSDLAARVRAVLRRRTGVDAETAEARMNGVPALREFVAGHVESIRNRVMDAVGRVFRRSTEAVQDDEPEELDDVFDPLDPEWESAADTVGQTQATSALNAAVSGAAAKASVDRTMSVEWVAILDSHTRLAHAEADGQRQPLGTPFSVGGEELRYPGDPQGSPDNVINCRCRLFARFTEPDPELVASAPATMADESTEERTVTEYRSFTSVLAVIGTPTDDGRMFADDIALEFRDFPLPLMWCKQSSGGHYDAYTVGVIEEARVEGKQVIGSGYFLNSEEAMEAAEQAEHGVTGPSVDLGSVDWELRDGKGNPISEEEYWDDPDMELVQVVLAAKVLAATLVSTPAFGETTITLGDMVERGEEALVAAAALPKPGLIDVPAYPAEMFSDPGFDGPTLPHITEEGRIQGHLAAFNVCHTGIQDACVIAPRSQTDYAWFHTAPAVKTEDGGRVKVGRLTVGGGHAGPRLSAGPAIAHYDDAGTCFALVHVGEDEHGIWFSGVPAPGATSEQVAAGLAAPLSGDWRNVGGNLELVAALAVNTPGFPIIASGATDEHDEPMALVASLGPCADEKNELSVQEDMVRRVIAEYRAAERRDAEALKLIEAETQRQAAALIEGMV